ncbi:MAG: hypothetical protein ABEH59_04105 [Halobacteriales archaeon]
MRTGAEEEPYRPVVESGLASGIERDVDARPTVSVQNELVNTSGCNTIRAAIEAEL